MIQFCKRLYGNQGFIGSREESMVMGMSDRSSTAGAVEQVKRIKSSETDTSILFIELIYAFPSGTMGTRRIQKW